MKDAYLAHRFFCDPAGGQVAYAAVGESDPGVGDVFELGKHIHADSVYFLDREETSPSTMSISWIIRSITTPMSSERLGKGDNRWHSMNRGSRIILVMAVKAELKRSTWPTCNISECFFAKAIKESAWRRSVVNGFSTRVCMFFERNTLAIS